jgi:hypothetical protein
MTRHLGSVHSVGLRGPTAPAQVCSALLLPHGSGTDNRYLIVECRRPRRQSVTRAMICGQCSLFVGGSHVSLTSQGVETA